MKAWFLPSVVALLAWGLWALLPKYTTRYIDPKSAIVFEVIGAAIIGLIVLATAGFRLEWHPKGVGLAVLTGMLGVTGALAYLYAVSKGPVSLISTATALYPVITIALAYLLLSETMSLRQLLGVVLALVSIWLITS